MEINKKDFYSTGEVAKLVGSTRQTVLRWVNIGRISAKKFGSHNRISKEELIRFQNQNSNENQSSQ